MRYLILGCNGMAGHMVAQYLLEAGHEVTGFARKKCKICSTVIGDVLDWDSMVSVLNSSKYDIIVNCIGVLNQGVDKRPSIGIFINSVLPHLIAEHLDGLDCRLIHISTDCVFSGIRGNYTEIDIPDEVTLYGRSKALGEVTYGGNLTLRTSIVGPELKEDGIGLFHWFMKQNDIVNGFSNTIWTGVTTLQLAKAVAKAAELKVTGLYHLVNNQQISKFELLQLFNQFCRNSKIQILKDGRNICKKTLVNTRCDVDFRIPSYENMIEEMGQWIGGHKELYKQY